MVAASTLQRTRVSIRGIVQGVGFRPFVCRLAREIGLSGSVRNCTAGVVVEVEGPDDAIGELIDRLRGEAPPLARIDAMELDHLPPRGDRAFSVTESTVEPGACALVAADVAMCDACRADVLDPWNHRYRYPFTTCTNCGPRYSIIRDIPYDRGTTTMAPFAMCAQCAAEYRDAADRRFHAETIACPACGPEVMLATADGTAARGHYALTETRRRLSAGELVAVRGLGGFHLACDATSDEAVQRLRARKRRGDKPFAVMVRDETIAAREALLSDLERRLLAGREHPIVIVSRAGGAISRSVAPQNDTIGLMLPYTPLHLLLFEEGIEALVMTSGNLSDEPIAISNEDALERLRGIADAFLLHDRDIHNRIDDSVVRVIDGRPRPIRRARAFAPHPIDLGAPAPPLLACGAELKSTVCLTRERSAFVSQHIGDLGTYETMACFEETVERLKKLFRITPQFVAHDLHPAYLSTRYAKESGLPAVGVQHHHAHIASCMAENGVQGPVIGVAMDGTGLGLDGRIWGGEFFAGDLARFERIAHLRYVPLAGGDAAVRQPWRCAISYWRDAAADGRPLELPVAAAQRRIVETMLDRRINVIDTSSCGRLFDAVASILGLRHEANFEAQAAIALEGVADRGAEGAYPFDIDDRGEPWTIDLRPAIRALAGERDAAMAAGKFHHTLASVIAEVCASIRRRQGIDRVCLSGGVFQNKLLTERAAARLRELRFQVVLHSIVPCNDGGISLGQAVIAAERVRRGEA